MPILDELRFIKAVEYADERYFSKPYAISHRCNFDKLAQFELLTDFR